MSSSSFWTSLQEVASITSLYVPIGHLGHLPVSGCLNRSHAAIFIIKSKLSGEDLSITWAKMSGCACFNRINVSTVTPPPRSPQVTFYKENSQHFGMFSRRSWHVQWCLDVHHSVSFIAEDEYPTIQQISFIYSVCSFILFIYTVCLPFSH